MRARILIVDDDANLLSLLRLHLQSAGYDVTVAEDAIKAGYSVLERVPDMIISDVQMPHMDGFEFISTLKRDRSIPDIPVIFLTSMVDADDRWREVGAVGYLVKPVRADRLLGMVAEHLGPTAARPPS